MKGLDYVAVDPGIAKDPRVALMAKALRRDRYWVAGHFPEFLGEVASHAPDGNLSGIPDDLLDQWAGGVKRWGTLVREHLCDEDEVLRAWWKYNGRALDRLRKDRARKHGRREDDPPDDEGGDSPDSPRNGGGNSTEVPRKIRGRSRDNTDTDTGTSLPVGRESTTTTGAHVRQAVPERYHTSLEAVLRASRAPDGVLEILWAMMNPEDGTAAPAGRPVDGETIGRALRELRASKDPGFNAAFFRGIVAKLKRDQLRSESPADAGDQMKELDRWAAGRSSHAA